MTYRSAAIAAVIGAFSLAFVPVASAQNTGNELKGPPNANGYGKEKMGRTTVDQESNGDARDMKGPPNANGYKKDQGQQ